MLNFSSISENSIAGKFLRFWLKLIPAKSRLFILQGRLKGKKWIKGSGINSYWLGTYELNEQKLFEKTIKQGDVVFDIGAHVGFYTILASELIGETGKVFAFEPLPRNIFYLERHIKINKCENVKIIKTAVSDKEGIAFLSDNCDSSYSRIIEDSGIEVKTVAIDNLVGSGKLPIPNVIKIDVEGAEFSVLKGASFTIKKYKPAIFLAIHRFTDKIHKDCCDFLMELGYELRPILGNKIEETDEIFAYKK